GKFLTMQICIAMLILLASIMPLSIIISGSLVWRQFVATIIGVSLTLTAAFAVCLCLSAFMANVVRANLLMFIVLAAFILIEWAAQYAGTQAIFLQSFGLLKPLKSFLAGIISLRATAYYVLIMLCFLCLGSWGYTRKCRTW